MFKYALLLTMYTWMAAGQRPPYAGTSNRYPVVLPRFREEQQNASTSTVNTTVVPNFGTPAQAPAFGAPAQAPAFGVASTSSGITFPSSSSGMAPSNSNVAFGSSSPSDDIGLRAGGPSSTTLSALDLPIDAHGDIDLVNRIATWPREKQPFWYINWRQIQEHRGNGSQNMPVPLPSPNNKPFFAG